MSTEVNVSSEVQEKGKPSIFGFITSPVVQFEKMKSSPVIWGPLLLILILTAATTILAVYTPQAKEALQQQKEAGIEVNSTFSMIGGAIGGVDCNSCYTGIHEFDFVFNCKVRDWKNNLPPNV